MPFTCQHIPYALCIGLDVSVAFRNSETLFNPYELISSLNFKFFDYIVTCVSVSSSALRYAFMSKPQTPVFIDDYYTISSSFYKTQFIAQLHNEDVADVSKHMQLLTLDLNFCNHLCVNCININCPDNGFSVSEQFDLVFILHSFFKRNPDRKVNFVISLTYKQLRTYQQLNSSLGNIDNFRLAIKLSHNENNSSYSNSNLLKETTAMNIVAVVIPISLFIKNKNGFPVLSKQLQSLLCELFTFKLDVIIHDDTSTAQHLSQSETYLKYIYDYYVYVKHLFQTHTSFTTNFDYVLCHYADVLQTPLQPLRDDLQSITYEAFEEDQVKYKQYASAIALAIAEMCEGALQQQKDMKVTIGVFGGGRGPLIRMVLSAIQSVVITYTNSNCVSVMKSNFKVFCVEKNINAFNTLLTLQQQEPQTFADVAMIYSDMRTFEPSLYDITHIDVCVSELLGSFGDNELSPECLEHITQYMSSNGIMIPQQYTSYIQPVYCPKTWMNIKLSNESYESPFIIKFKKAFFPVDEVKPCFSFRHNNNNDMNVSAIADTFNQRQSVKFVFTQDSAVSGFAGYFEAVLYKDVTLSILPGSKHTSGLNSWFPVFFPSVKEIFVKENEMLVINVRRVNDMKRVWYEWSFAAGNDVYGVNCKVHNCNGDCYAMLL